MVLRSTMACLVIHALAGAVFAQPVENGDYRIRAEFRAPDNGGWASDESVGHAEFRVKSRFMQVYYGGVSRLDEYRFRVLVDFTDTSDFDEEFGVSPYNTNYDTYINEAYVGRIMMSNDGYGTGVLEYDSRHPSPPATLTPPGFPDPVNAFDTIRVYFAAGSAPAIGASLPPGTPVFEAEFVEEFARGDVDLDGEVDMNDFVFLQAGYDPLNTNGPHIGPASGDFTGDNLSNLADYDVMAANWTDNDDIPPAPVVIGTGDFNADGVVNAADLAQFVGTCFQGPGIGAAAGCIAFDLDTNGNIDLKDYAALQALVRP